MTEISAHRLDTPRFQDAAEPKGKAAARDDSTAPGQRGGFHGWTDYAPPLLQLMAEMGMGRTADVIALFEQRFGDLIPATHKEHDSYGIAKWKNYVQWCRSSLVGIDLMGSHGRGVWTITEAGRTWLRDHPDGARDALAARLKQDVNKRYPRQSGVAARRAVKDRAAAASPTASVTLAKLNRIKSALPAEQFQHDWGDEYDRLIAEERSKTVTDISQTELGRRARLKLDEVHTFLGGGKNTPGSEVLCEWIQFCFVLDLPREAASLLQYVMADEVDAATFRRVKRLADVSRTKLGW